MQKSFFNAFTLAEVLITLGIIGIVAALTIPQFIANYKEKVFVTKAKQSFNTMTNALTNYNTKNGSLGDFSSLFINSENATELNNNFASELNAIKVCNENVNQCGGPYKAKQYKKLNDGKGHTQEISGNMNSNRIIMNDGSFVSLRNLTENGNCIHTYLSNYTDENGNYIPDSTSPTGYKSYIGTSDSCGVIYIDTNGMQPPNQTGIDFFWIRVTSEKTIPSNSYSEGGLGYILKYDKLIPTENYTIGDY